MQDLIEGFRTCVWTPLPDGWEEFRDPATKQPYYFHRASGQKAWERPVSACAHVTGTSTTLGGTRATQQQRRKAAAVAAGELAVADT